MSKNNPLAEVFGFPISTESETAKYYRENRLCPYHNRFPNCTKDKANDPLGVCSVNHGDNKVITCPSRFREDWKILHDAASFVWPKGTKWTSLPEIKLVDANGQSVTENNVTLPWTKSIEAKLPFTAKMEGTFSYNAADLPDQVVYGRRYGIGTYDGNALVISLVGNMGTQSKEAFLNTMAEHPDRLQFSQEENF